MPRYEIRSDRPLLIDGQQVTPDDVIAHVYCDLPVRDVLSLVQFGGATITDPDAQNADESDESDEDSEDAPAGDFAHYAAKVQAGLAAAGITTLAQAALYVRDHGSLEPLDGIGKATSKLILKEIEAAGIPLE